MGLFALSIWLISRAHPLPDPVWRTLNQFAPPPQTTIIEQRDVVRDKCLSVSTTIYYATDMAWYDIDQFYGNASVHSSQQWRAVHYNVLRPSYPPSGADFIAQLPPAGSEALTVQITLIHDSGTPIDQPPPIDAAIAATSPGKTVYSMQIAYAQDKHIYDLTCGDNKEFDFHFNPSLAP